MALVTLLVCAFATLGAQAEPTTTCSFGGPVSGYRAMTIDVPDGSDFLHLKLNAARSFPRVPNSEGGWHLAEGIAVIDADTHEIVSHHVLHIGTAVPVVVAESDGEAVRQPVPAPEGPWVHDSRNVRPDLAPGRYHVVAFGVGGPDSGAFVQDWGGSIHLQGTHACHAAATGETFDLDHTEFSGGTQLYAAGVGIAEDIALDFQTPRPLVFGLMDAAVQGGETGSVALDYAMPGRTGSLGREIVPFVSSAGSHAFEADYQGLYPIVAIAGVALEIP